MLETENHDFSESPNGLKWICDKGLIGNAPFTQLQPWYRLDQPFDVNQKWPAVQSSMHLIAFARRQDNDDIACYLKNVPDAERVVVIHGWTDKGYNVIKEYPDFWDWMKDVVNDIAEWSSLD